MPLFSDGTHHGNRLLIWHMEESEELLSSMLPPAITCNYGSAQRRKEFYTLRVMAMQTGINPQDILYTPDGAPFIEGGPFVSFSHTKEYAAILISPTIKRIGVDVEMLSSRFLKVESHYLNQAESKAIREELPKGMRLEDALGLWWNAKEALYKAAGERVIRFTEDFQIFGLAESLTENQNGSQAKKTTDNLTGCSSCRFSGELSTQYRGTVYQITYRVMDDFSLACCFAE